MAQNLRHKKLKHRARHNVCMQNVTGTFFPSCILMLCLYRSCKNKNYIHHMP